jgi:hypothetical protein
VDGGCQAVFQQDWLPAYGIASDYVDGSPIRQDYMETAIDWLSEATSTATCRSTSTTRSKAALELFSEGHRLGEGDVSRLRREMKHVRWGPPLQRVQDKKLDAKKLAKEVAKLMEDDEVGRSRASIRIS